MARSGGLLVLLAGIVSAGIVSGIEWNVLPDDYMYACAGSKVTFPWDFKLMHWENVVNVNWIHDGSLSSTLMATFVRQQFVPTSGYSGRVRYMSNGGLVLEDLFVDDSGNYTVEVNVVGDRIHDYYKKSVHLQVADGLMLQGPLKAEQDPGTWMNQSSQEWFLRLTCGSFTFNGPPPVHLVWTTPSGQTLPSSGYESGYFYLSLAVPVRGGNYTCSIPPARLPDLCYREHGQHDQHVAFSASVAVDETKARMSLLETNQKTLLEDRSQLMAKQQSLLEENAQLQARLLSLEQTHEQDVQNLTEYCRETVENLDDQLDSMQSVQQSLMDKVNETRQQTKPSGVPTEGVTEPPYSGPCRSDQHTVIDDSWRSTKEGSSPLHCDDDLASGWYRFMLNGENADMPTSCVPVNHCGTHAPQWLDLRGYEFPAVGEQREGRACAHWSDNCCNWQSDITVRNCGSYYVYKLNPRDNCHLAYCVEPA